MGRPRIEASAEARAAAQQAPEATDTNDYFPVPADHMELVNAGLEPLPQECLDPLIGLAAGVATGRLTMEQLQDKFTTMSKPSQNP